MANSSLIALDADGVLLDFGLAYAGAWERAFGVRPCELDPGAYWPLDRWAVTRLEGAQLDSLRNAFDDEFWSSIPPMPGAVEACQRLVAAGNTLVCVSALPLKHKAARERNLQRHGFPIEVVHATDNVATLGSPKALTLNALKPAAFVDDYLPYFVGVDAEIHRALILRASTGSPNHGALLSHTDSGHPDLAGFANWWVSRPRD